MQSGFIRPAAAAALALGLSACATHPPLLAANEPSFVDKVDVALRQPAASATFAEAARKATRREATRYGRAGAAKTVRVVVMDLHYKNAALSLLVGDANRVAAQVVVADAASGEVHGQFVSIATDQAALNGVSGAMISVFQDRAVVDQRLAQGLASDVLERVYGTAAAEEARKRPVIEIVEETTPAVAPATPAPKPAPRAPGEDRTAMAGPAATASVPLPIAR